MHDIVSDAASGTNLLSQKTLYCLSWKKVHIWSPDCVVIVHELHVVEDHPLDICPCDVLSCTDPLVVLWHCWIILFQVLPTNFHPINCSTQEKQLSLHTKLSSQAKGNRLRICTVSNMKSCVLYFWFPANPAWPLT